MSQTVIIRGDSQRDIAKRLIDAAPINAVVNIKPAKRSVSQNDMMWALLSDVSRSKPQGRSMTPERWKAVFMSSLGHAVQFEHDLEGRPFPIGMKSSALTKAEMGDLIEQIFSYGAEHGVRWSEQPLQDLAA